MGEQSVHEETDQTVLLLQIMAFCISDRIGFDIHSSKCF
jgi:hypothetical protein